MKLFWRIAYDWIALPLIRGAARVLARFRPKVARGLEGRGRTFHEIGLYLDSLPGGRAVDGGIWFHGTSVGEFLQAVPLMTKLKEQRPGRPVYFSFFSPSVEQRARQCPHCDLSFYLPEDTRANARQLFDLLRPGLLVFSKFDIWRNIVLQARELGVPVAVTAATLSPDSGRLRGLSGSFHRGFYSLLDLVCAISDEDADGFIRLGVPADRCIVTGDTRFDQTFERASKVGPDDPLVRPFSGWGDKPTLALGSTWPADEEHLLPALESLAREFPELRFILVPHETTAEHLDNIRAFLEKHGLTYTQYTSLENGSGVGRRVSQETRAVLVDRVGVLAAVYRAAHLVYVGGGFGSGVHNVMEPACFGLPVMFGPRHLNSYEARLMLARGGAFAISDTQGAVEVIQRLLREPELRAEAGEAASAVVRENLGATGRTLAMLAGRYPEVAG